MKFASDIPSNVRPGTNIIDYLVQRFTYHSVEKWRSIVIEGLVTIDDRTATPQDCVNPGSKVCYDAGDFEEPEANLGYRIVFEDEWFIGIDKPGNLLVHRAGKSFKNNLIYHLRYIHNPPCVSAHATHRIDRDTSGVVLIAKDPKTHAAMSAQFAQQLIGKTYYAVVYGIPDRSRTIIDEPIGKSETSAISYKYKVIPDGKPAVTEIIDVAPIGNTFSLVTVKPRTGRTHQIRIHLDYIGHPIVGDKLYGMSEVSYIQWRDDPHNVQHNLPFYRHALHCGTIEFTHPFTNELCSIEAELPSDIKTLIDQLRTI